MNVYIFVNKGVALSNAGIWWGIQWVVKCNLLSEVVLPGIAHAGPWKSLQYFPTPQENIMNTHM